MQLHNSSPTPVCTFSLSSVNYMIQLSWPVLLVSSVCSLYSIMTTITTQWRRKKNSTVIQTQAQKIGHSGHQTGWVRSDGLHCLLKIGEAAPDGKIVVYEAFNHIDHKWQFFRVLQYKKWKRMKMTSDFDDICLYIIVMRQLYPINKSIKALELFAWLSAMAKHEKKTQLQLYLKWSASSITVIWIICTFGEWVGKPQTQFFFKEPVKRKTLRGKPYEQSVFVTGTQSLN